MTAMSSRTLLLIRHAKAEAEGPNDADRRLVARGHADAAMAGQWLAELEVTLELVVLSPATRARETWDEISEAVWAANVESDERIYEATVDDLLAALADLPESVSSVALVGHKPGMHALAFALDDGKGDPEASAEIARQYPTCGIAVFDVPGPWSDLSADSATLFTFASPRAPL
jgi:phosphohistidine phosphatase